MFICFIYVSIMRSILFWVGVITNALHAMERIEI